MNVKRLRAYGILLPLTAMAVSACGPGGVIIQPQTPQTIAPVSGPTQTSEPVHTNQPPENPTQTNTPVQTQEPQSPPETSQKSVAAEPKKGTYRVTINGLYVRSETWDHALEVDGKGDEVYIDVRARMVDETGKDRGPARGNTSVVMGDTNGQGGRVQAGSRSSNGGLKTGDSVPESATSGYGPWVLSSQPKADRLPLDAGTFTLTEGKDKVLISPTIWEWDGGKDVFADWTAWMKSATDQIPAEALGATGVAVKKATQAGLGLALSLSDKQILGQASDRPIGIQAQGAEGFTFDPYVMTLDYASAESLVSEDDGKGTGVKTIIYKDSDKYHGQYELYLQVTKVG